MNNAAPLLAAFALVFVASQRPKRRKRTAAPRVRRRRRDRHGIEITRDRIVIVSWDKWLAWAPDRILESVQNGIEYPEQILVELFRDMYPALPWPPPPESPYLAQWDDLVASVERSLPRTAANGATVRLV